MARGVDSWAHRGALKANGCTIAVLGSGVDVIYPPENRKLYHQIMEHGAVISEFPIKTKLSEHQRVNMELMDILYTTKIRLP